MMKENRAGLSLVCGVRRHLVPLVVALVVVPSLVEASPLTVYGYNARGISMGEAQVAAADDASAVFHNPALLTRQRRPSVLVGAQLATPTLWISPVDVAYQAERPPSFPDQHLQWNLGAAVPLDGRLAGRVAVGLALSLPHSYVVRVESIDGASPQFPIHQNSTRKLTLSPAVAVSPASWISFGVGRQVLSNFVGGVDIEVDLFTRRVEHRAMLVDIIRREAWTVGVTAGPLRGLMLGASFRQELGLDYILPARLDIEDVGVIELRLEGVGIYSPHEFTVGAVYAPEDASFIVSFDLTHAWWSRAPSPQAVAMIDTSGDVLDGLGLGEAFDLCSDIETRDESTGERACRPNSPGYANNIVPKVGVEMRPLEPLALRFGYRYWPTPVPNQVGRTNYLDSSSHHFSMGLGYQVHDPLEVLTEPLEFDLALHVISMRKRDVDKGSDGRVEYSFGGHLTQLSMALRYRF